MKKESSKILLAFSVLALVLLAFPGKGSALAAQGFTLFGDTADNKVTPNCYLRKEYNYFMNQWTTNEVCNPRVDQVAPKPLRLGNSNANIVDNVYLGPTTSYPAPVYNSAPSYTGFYTGNNNSYANNNWNGYGSASNYLLGSFGGGVGSYGYYNNYYPNSVFTYTPTSYSARNSWYSGSDDYYYDSYSTSFSGAYDSDLYLDDYGTYNGNTYATVGDDYGNSVTSCPECSRDDLNNMADTFDYGGLDW